jgi:hypothetical protein
VFNNGNLKEHQKEDLNNAFDYNISPKNADLKTNIKLTCRNNKFGCILKHKQCRSQ